MRFSIDDWNGGPLRFRDRRDAGRQLAERLQSRADVRPIVIALPRGGVEVGYEVARELNAPLDVWVVRKVGVPWHPELGVGAVAEGGYTYTACGMLATLGLSEADLAETIERERLEVEERVRIFRGSRARPELSGRTVLLVVAAPEVLEELAPEVDDIVCLLSPSSMFAIGLWYQDFRQVSNDEVVRLLEQRRNEEARSQRMRAAPIP